MCVLACVFVHCCISIILIITRKWRLAKLSSYSEYEVKLNVTIRVHHMRSWKLICSYMHYYHSWHFPQLLNTVTKSSNYEASSVWMIDQIYAKQIWAWSVYVSLNRSLLVEHFCVKEKYHREWTTGRGWFPKMLWEWQGGPLQHKHNVCQSRGESWEKTCQIKEYNHPFVSFLLLSQGWAILCLTITRCVVVTGSDKWNERNEEMFSCSVVQLNITSICGDCHL